LSEVLKLKSKKIRMQVRNIFKRKAITCRADVLKVRRMSEGLK